MSKRRKSSPKVVVEVPVATPVMAAAEPPPVEVKPLRPEVVCFRCSAKGGGKVCPRCSVVLGHSGQKEARLYRKPVTSMTGY